MRIHFIYIIYISILFLGCRSENITTEYQTMKDGIMQTGNIKEYNKLILLAQKHDIDVTDVSRTMANVYNYPYAFYCVFNSFTVASSHPDYYSLSGLCDVDRVYALNYLYQGYVRNEINSVKAVNYYIDNGKDYFVRENKAIKLSEKYSLPFKQ